MQKIVIDTNVLVSALIQRNYPHLIIYNLFIGLIKTVIAGLRDCVKSLSLSLRA
jgi:predicted nucleic acid-binding protein